MTAAEKAPTDRRMRCSECGVEAEAACGCHAYYVPPGVYAALYAAKHPEMTNQAIADATGVPISSVRRARISTCSNEQVEKRKGKDGKIRPASYKKRENVVPFPRRELMMAVHEFAQSIEQVRLEDTMAKLSPEDRRRLDEDIAQIEKWLDALKAARGAHQEGEAA